MALVVSLLALLVSPAFSTSLNILHFTSFFTSFFYIILSFNLFIVFPALASCLNTFWIFCNFLWCFFHVYFKVQGKKVKTKFGSHFWTSCFWFSQGKGKTCHKATWKTTGSPWKIVVHLFQMWEQRCIFHRKTGQVYLWRNICIQQVSWLSQ